jgi:hypothetical protein
MSEKNKTKPNSTCRVHISYIVSSSLFKRNSKPAKKVTAAPYAGTVGGSWLCLKLDPAAAAAKN